MVPPTYLRDACELLEDMFARRDFAVATLLELKDGAGFVAVQSKLAEFLTSKNPEDSILNFIAVPFHVSTTHALCSSCNAVCADEDEDASSLKELLVKKGLTAITV